MRSINRITLLGNVGHAPAIKSFDSGDKIVSFSLATGDSWKDKATGDWKTNTTWHRIVIKSPVLCDVAEKYISKGSLVYIEGKLEERTYTDKNNIERTIQEVCMYPSHQLIVLNREKEDHEQKPMPYAADSSSSTQKQYQKPSSNIMEHVAYQDIEDDIPFN